jgi:acyl-CoA thioesterase-1
MKKQGVFILFLVFIIYGCDKDEEFESVDSVLETTGLNINSVTEAVDLERIKKDLRILSLGDSYTIGTSVCEICNYPKQLRSILISTLGSDTKIELDILAANGWTTADLIKEFKRQQILSDYDLVTLLIGVNNQFQGLQFSIYKNEFIELVEEAIFSASNDKKRIVVLSIPDYAYTPFGNQNELISRDIDKYNVFASQYCFDKGISYIDITDISRQGIENPDLIANDNLHLSKLAYKKFVERLLPIVLNKLPRE